MQQGVDEIGRPHTPQKLHVGTGHLRAPPSAAGPGKQQQGPVSLAAQTVVAGGQQCLQRIFGDGILFLPQRTALGVGLAGARQQLAHIHVLARVFDLPQLVRLGQHRQPVDQRVVRHRAQLGFVATVHQRLVDVRRQFGHQPFVGGALGMVHDELQHTRYRHRQLNRPAIAQPIPASPVTQGTAVAGQRVFGFTFTQQIVDRTLGQLTQGLRLQNLAGVWHRQVFFDVQIN